MRSARPEREIPMNDRAGFSLIEVLCAILILGVGLTGMVHGITSALRSSHESERQTIAALLAAGQIETLRAEGYLVRGREEGNGSGPMERYRWTQRVSDSAIEGLYEVEVSVFHGESDEVIYRLQTMLFDPPLLSRREDSGSRARSREKQAR
jgi:prepilin-type N-terminal cleavage/methylation domain-containing protein